ncbi:MAG: hypothetical protein EBS55_09140 [Flavobacteriaceae bacterium]|nr:hypothetical protein [Flavobacteriaceae bacterium]
MILAFVDAFRINNNKFIDHYYNAMIYTVFVAIAYYWRNDWLMVGGLFLIRIPVFNTTLNFLRDLPLTYISKSPASVVDKIINPIIRLLGYWVFNVIVFVASIFMILYNVYTTEFP